MDPRIKNISNLEKIFDEEGHMPNRAGDNLYQGLQIIAKYINPQKTTLVRVVSSDQIWTVSADEILRAGLVLEDAKELAGMGWIIDDGSLSCFISDSN